MPKEITTINYTFSDLVDLFAEKHHLDRKTIDIHIKRNDLNNGMFDYDILVKGEKVNYNSYRDIPIKKEISNDPKFNIKT